MQTQAQLEEQEVYKRILEKKNASEREHLVEFIKSYWVREKKEELVDNWHIHVICDALERVFRGEIKRLMINVPPRSLKTEIVSKAFPIWCMGQRQNIKFMGISYSATLAEDNSDAARRMYESDTYGMIFPRRAQLSESQNTKQRWVNEKGGYYYAAGATGTITGKGADIIIIDDPLKPGDADSPVERPKVNNKFHDTIRSRLNEPNVGAIIIIMQRLHDDDLCGHLIEQEVNGTGEQREKIIIPAIAEGDETYRKQGESFFPARFPIEMLHQMKGADRQTFSSQYQQNPVDKDTQEFHDGWFRYHGEGTDVETPKDGRVFTTVDPAFKQGMENDQTCIMTGKFIADKLYILEYSAGRYTAEEMMQKIIHHIQKRSPEKVGIEAFQAQSMILSFLKPKLKELGLLTNIEEIKQTGDKLSKIRRLINPYRNGLIYHKKDMDALEGELRRFPRGKHDDIIDAEQMLYDLYQLQPNSVKPPKLVIQYDSNGRPFIQR